MRIIAWPYWHGTSFQVYLTRPPKISRKTGLKLEDESGPAQRKIIEIDNKKVYAAGAKVVKLTGETARAYLRTINDATWDDARKRKLHVSYDRIRALLYKRDGGS